MSAPPAITPAQAIDALWRVGDLSYLLHETQETMRSAIALSSAEVYVINCARRLGKSFLACSLAIEQCLQVPGSQVRYAAPTAKAVRKIVTPNMRKILADCPEHCRPQWNMQDGTWTFPNGSEIHVAGVNNGHADDLRGVESHLCLVDEAGFVKRGGDTEREAGDDDAQDELEYLVDEVLMPQLLTTDGRIVLLSTPPRTPAHSFIGYCTKAEAERAYSRFTLYDAKHIPRDRIERFIAKAGGPTANKVRREYFAEFVVDEARAVLPEFSKNETAIIEERQRPEYFVPIIVGDIGYHDHSFIGFGYHDFRAGIDYVEEEYVVKRTLARDMDAAASAIAVALWGERLGSTARRFADAPAQVIAELNGPERSATPWTGIAKTQTDGTFLVAATNDLRTRLGAESPSVRIHPRCKRLRAHARNAVWKTPGKDYERMAGYGHFDGVAMLTYFVRMIDRRTNPFPRIPDGYSSDTHIIPDEWLGEESGRENLRTLARRGSGKR